MQSNASSVRRASLVLIVDDDQDCREMYARFLRDAGFQVAEAHNGHQALAKAADERPSIVVTDLALPGLDGYHVARTLRGQAATAGVPIIAITGYGTFKDDVARALAAGCEAVLVKPCLPDRLLEEIERVLAAKKTPA